MIKPIGSDQNDPGRTTNRLSQLKNTTPNRFDAERATQDLLTHPSASRETRPRLFESKIGGENPLTGLDPYLSPESVARYLDVSRKFVYELMARREIESVSVGGRLKRIRLSALETWLGRRNGRRQA